MKQFRGRYLMKNWRVAVLIVGLVLPALAAGSPAKKKNGIEDLKKAYHILGVLVSTEEEKKK